MGFPFTRLQVEVFTMENINYTEMNDYALAMEKIRLQARKNDEWFLENRTRFAEADRQLQEVMYVMKERGLL
jgi:hypothetical protein